MIGPYVGTGGSGTTAEPWPPVTDTTPALHEQAGEDPTEVQSGTRYMPGVTNVESLPTIRSRRSNEITRPEVDPFAEALFLAGYLPDEAVPWILSPEEIRYQKENLVRVGLLARKYVATEFSPEEDARLQIVRERVRRLLPRVTEADFQTLANELLKLQEIKSEHARIRKDAGLGE